MSKIIETSLIVKKDTSLEKIRRLIYKMLFKEEYLIEMEINNLIRINKLNPKHIVIPREIKIEKYKKL